MNRSKNKNSEIVYRKIWISCFFVPTWRKRWRNPLWMLRTSTNFAASVPRIYFLKSTSVMPKSYESYERKKCQKVTKVTRKKPKITDYLTKITEFWQWKYLENILVWLEQKFLRFFEKNTHFLLLFWKISKITDFWAFVTCYELKFFVTRLTSK